MKLATFTQGGVTRIGAVTDKLIVDLNAAAPDLPTEMIFLLEAGDAAMEVVQEAAGKVSASIPLSDVHLEATVLHPRKYLAIGLNYESHAAEAAKVGLEKPKYQVWFNKQVSCINGPYDPIHLPSVSDKLDYECELGLVIGKRCRHVSRDNATSVIGGYLICNDVSVRDWQMRSPTVTLGKSFDTHGPIGPWLVTPDEMGDPHDLNLKTLVNGEVRQDGNTRDLIFDCYDQVAELSTVFTLEPGDILSTGTPQGVGALMEPPQFMAEGDVVRVEIDKIGYIENKVVREPI